MTEMNRCKGCGYLHVGPAPDVCPVCGAPRSLFAPYANIPDLEGTKTLENLRAAYSGESQANRLYTLFRRIAELEGAPQSVLDAFDRAAREETAHAHGHLAYMSGFGDTRANLEKAAAGEDYECQDMYPLFAATAEEEGFDDIAFYFRSVGKYEASHRDEYKKALGELA